MVIKQIDRYVQGELSEEEAIDLWVHLLTHPEDLELLECYLMCKMYFGEGDTKDT